MLPARFVALLLGLVGCAVAWSCGGSRGSDDAGSPSATGQSAGVKSDPSGLHLTFTYGSEKQNWIEEATARFNAERHKTAGGTLIQVDPTPMGSGEVIDEILAGTRKPDLISPASAAFIKLGNAESRTRTGKDLVGPTQNLVLSPVVIAMWQPMAEALGWGKRLIGWADVVNLARKPEGWGAYGHPEWGKFRFGHTHPRASNSGLISLLAEAYAGVGKIGALTLDDVREPQTGQFIESVEQAVVHYGSSTGFFGRTMFANGPGYLSAAVLYESMVIESRDPQKYQLPFPIVAIYPKEGTFWSDHPVGIVQREWVTPEREEAAKAYISFLLAKPQQERAITFGFRPGDPAVPLAAPIDQAHGVNPREPQTTLEVPDPAVMNALLDAWERVKKTARVVLAIDVSGSMNDQGKIAAARDGATEFLSALGERDDVGLVTFNKEVRWVTRPTPVGPIRPSLLQTVRGLFADGGTALYDAVDQAYSALDQTHAPSKISAVVVLSDGADRDSTMALEALLDRIKFDSESRPIRVFTIGYGKDAKTDVLEKIAAITQGRFFAGKPENIRQVFRDISTFF